MNGTELEVRRAAVPLTIEQVCARAKLVHELLRDAMTEGVHYGKIPGCGPKPALLQPGAQKLCVLFQLVTEGSTAREDLPDGHREYIATVTLRDHNTGLLAATGLGCCSTLETKFLRKAGPVDVYNTVLKMAWKRAFVHAVINATAASDIFTQDIEDAPENYQTRGNPPPERPQSKRVNGEGEPPQGDVRVISEKQRKRFYAICKGGPRTDEQASEELARRGIASSTAIPAGAVYDDLCDWADGK